MPTSWLMVLRRGRTQKEVRVRKCFSWWNTDTLTVMIRCCGPLTSYSPTASLDKSFHIVGVALTQFFKVSLSLFKPAFSEHLKGFLEKQLLGLYSFDNQFKYLKCGKRQAIIS